MQINGVSAEQIEWPYQVIHHADALRKGQKREKDDNLTDGQLCGRIKEAPALCNGISRLRNCNRSSPRSTLLGFSILCCIEVQVHGSRPESFERLGWPRGLRSQNAETSSCM